MDVIKNADHVIDLGPMGGDRGGRVVAQGTPEQVAIVEASYTGQYLRKILPPERLAAARRAAKRNGASANGAKEPKAAKNGRAKAPAAKTKRAGQSPARNGAKAATAKRGGKVSGGAKR